MKDEITKKIDKFLSDLFSGLGLEGDNKAQLEKERIKIEKIRQVILQLATKFSHLQIKEIAEECGERDIKKIIKIIKLMIEDHEIEAKYYESTKAVAFIQIKQKQENNSPQNIPSPIPSEQLEIPSKLNYNNQSYIILKKITEGGMGIIYLAENAILDKKIILKQLKKQKYFINEEESITCEEYWAREQRIISKQSQSPFPSMHLIGAIHAAIGSNLQKEYFLLLEYIKGSPLDQWIFQYLQKLNVKMLPLVKIIEILEKIIIPLCHHIAFIHNQGLVHRDITPKNIIIQETDNSISPILIDWGISKEVSINEMFNPKKPYFTITRIGATGIHSIGNPPESVGGFNPIAATDVYMIGHIIYYILSGGQLRLAPVVTSDYIINLKTVNSEIPTSLQQLVQEMTQYEPADRIQPIEKIIEKLKIIIKDIQIQSKPETSDTYITPSNLLNEEDTYISSKNIEKSMNNKWDSIEKKKTPKIKKELEM